MTVREEQLEVTRRRILDACALLALGHGGLDDPTLFTYARVAELAGVSERTVYRAFPTKQALSAAFLDASALTQGEAAPTEAGQLAGFLRRVCHAWSERFPTLEADRAAALAARDNDDWRDTLGGRSTRDRAVVASVTAALHEVMTVEEQRGVAGVIRLLASLRSVAQTAARFDLTLAQAGDAHAWAIETLIASLQRDTEDRTCTSTTSSTP